MTRLTRISGLRLLLLIALLGGHDAWAAAAEGFRAYLEVSPDNTQELDSLLNTLEASLGAAGTAATPEPVIVVLHGEEASAFTRQSYLENRALVDRAALLDAYDMIDVRMCETWMTANGVRRADLLPFIDTVPYAPEEIRRLEEAGYRPYGAATM